jgi:Uri superfamily endonuclease
MPAVTRRKGTYALFLTFAAAIETDVGALGACRLEPGTYCYVGSAMGGLDARIGRHLAPEKKPRWHIDRLTVLDCDRRAYVSYPDPLPECELGRIALDCGAEIAVRGFGCSDCGCGSHLLRTDGEVMRRFIARARLTPFEPDAAGAASSGGLSQHL